MQRFFAILFLFLWYDGGEVIIMSLRTTIGANIKQIRLQKNMTQEELASVLFITRQTLSNYETGRSNPDLDMLQKIAAALDVDLTCLLYGSSPSRKKPVKQTVLQVILLSILAAGTAFLCHTTNIIRATEYRPAAYVLVRSILVPFTMMVLGYVLLQIIDCCIGIAKPTPAFKKAGAIWTVSILSANVLFTIPYMILNFLALFPGPDGSISLTFPPIPVYQEIAFFFLSLMYNYPFVYVLMGMSLWIFRPAGFALPILCHRS